MNPLHVLDDIEKERTLMVDKYIASNPKPVGFDTLMYEQGLVGVPKPHGVDFRTFQSQTKEDNKHDEQYMQWSRLQKGETSFDDYSYAGNKRHDPKIVRHIGYDTPNARSDAAPQIAAPTAVRSITSAYAGKRGFHEGWNPARQVEDEVESQVPHLRIVGSADPDGVEVAGNFRKTEALKPDVVTHGMNGLLQHGWQIHDQDKMDRMDSFRKHMGTDDTGFDHGGPFRAGRKRFEYHSHLQDRSQDADDVPYTGEEDTFVPADSYGTKNFVHDSTPNQHNRLATEEGGFRTLANRGAVGSAIEDEMRQFL